MGEDAGHLDTDQADLAAMVQRLQGMVQHLRSSHESEAETVTRLRARVQNAENAFESAWTVIRRLEADVSDLRGRLETFNGPGTSNATNNQESAPPVGPPGRFDEHEFFESPKERGGHAR